MQPTFARAPALACLLALLCAAPALARDPAARIDAAKRNRISTAGSTITPEVTAPERADGVQDKRFDHGELREQPRATVGDRRAGIDLKEGRDKNLVTPELKTYEQLNYDTNAYSDRRSGRFNTGEQTYRTALVERYQTSLSDAAEAAPKTVVKERTTFDSLNRFIFRRNRPQGDDLMTAAGSESAAPAAGAQP